MDPAVLFELYLKCTAKSEYRHFPCQKKKKKFKKLMAYLTDLEGKLVPSKRAKPLHESNQECHKNEGSE